MESKEINSPTPPGNETGQEFEPMSEAQIKLEAKTQIRDALAYSPLWQEMPPEEQEKMAEDLFNRTFTIFLDEYEKRRKNHEGSPKTEKSF